MTSLRTTHLLVVRHAVAESKKTFAHSGQPDELRPLTPGGTARMLHVARGLHAAVPSIDLLATSPLVRARQTADLLCDEFNLKPVVARELAPESPFAAFESWAKRRLRVGSMTAIVGHEPHLSGLVAWLIGDSGDTRISLGKGGACLLEFEGKPRRARGTLLWLVSPTLLRRLRR